MPLISRDFRRRRPLDPVLAERLPPGQHLVKDFPVLTVWETHGYHRRGDPWREERYRGD